VSIDTTFQPKTDTYAVDNTAAVQIKEAGQVGAITFRIRALIASGYISWGTTNAVTSKGAPAIGTPVSNTIGVTLNVPVYLELPPNTWFIGNAAFATSGFEITGGQGGAGG
jgi:hypothetical protein